MALLSINSKRTLSLIADISKDGLYEFGGFIKDLAELLYDPYRKVWAGTTPRKIYYSVNSLNRNGYLEKIEKGNRKIIRITNKGRLVLLQEKINQQQHNKKWDRKWRLVIFDIPENDRRERNFLRSYLKSFGLKELQKSVWVFPYDMEKEFKEFLKLCNKKFEGDVRFLTIEKIDRDSDLKSHFKLITPFRKNK